MNSTPVANASSSQRERARLTASRSHCRRIARHRARNFYYGMKLVPEPKRSAMYALYGWMREADDLADAAGDAESKAAALERFRRTTRRVVGADPRASHDAAVPDGPLWPAVRDMARTYCLPETYLDAMIDGQLLDQRKTRYGTFDELYDYCYKVASVVGLSCIEIWGYEGGEETRQLSEWRGIAFQLTNILRDVLEDAERDRVYMPAEDFDVFELSPLMFTVGNEPPEAVEGIRRVAERARAYYEKSAPLDRYVHSDGRPCLYAMTEIYRALLEKIERDPAAVLRGERVRLGGVRKGWIALNASWRKGWGRA